MKKIILTIFVLLCTFNAYAESRYVTDKLQVTMRSGESRQHRIVRMLKSGQKVEVISSNKQNGYAKIKVGDKTGYVLLGQLMSEPSAREQLATAQAKLDELQAEPDALSAQLSRTRDELKNVSSQYQAVKQDRDELAKELESLRYTSQNAVRIQKERNNLRTQLQELDMQTQELQQKNNDLARNTTQKWFMIGGGVLTLGIILGLILPHLRFQRKNDSWGTL
ncbi:MAG: TIGR04211 family SH3 domain-containing protein [gamma proteobacterium symbiont of Bathyaustriella thionipta]|nr:TIGR04211 family SH3 domain-containing protein [gamma proteobacterium symbiont of Bathyaustriella thionipta]